MLESIFEADFKDDAYGYRPARGAAYAVKDVYPHLSRGYTDVVGADLRQAAARRSGVEGPALWLSGQADIVANRAPMTCMEEDLCTPMAEEKYDVVDITQPI